VSARPQQPEPFLRGCIYPGLSDTSYPRANPSDSEHLPADVWQAAQIPAGVRLEFVGEVDAVRIFYETTTANFGYRGEGAGCTFSIYRSGQKIAEQEAVLGQGVVELPLCGEPNRPVIVYLPEGMRPIVTGIEGIGGPIEPAPRQPRWLCYGDAVTQGWLASAPSLAWPAVTARKLGLDLINFGYAGSSRTDTAAALTLTDIPAEILSVSIGTNNWSRFPHTPALCAEEVRAVISLLRSGHPDAPIVIVSPLLRPEAEDTPNRLGATLTELRIATEEAVRELMMSGDVRLSLVEGSTIVSAGDLEDGRHPGDDGHIRIAAAVGKVISPLVGDLRSVAETHWAAELAAAMELASPSPQLPSTDFLRQVGTGFGPITYMPAPSGPAVAAPAPNRAPSPAAPVAPAPAAAAPAPAAGAAAAPAPAPAPAAAPAPAGPVPAVSASAEAPANPAVPTGASVAGMSASPQSPSEPTGVSTQPSFGPIPSFEVGATYDAPVRSDSVPAGADAVPAGVDFARAPQNALNWPVSPAASSPASTTRSAPPSAAAPPEPDGTQYILTPTEPDDDSNWAAELAGAQLAAEQVVLAELASRGSAGPPEHAPEHAHQHAPDHAPEHAPQHSHQLGGDERAGADSSGAEWIGVERERERERDAQYDEAF
jgi:lysophospholipase L1-like esterase